MPPRAGGWKMAMSVMPSAFDAIASSSTNGSADAAEDEPLTIAHRDVSGARHGPGRIHEHGFADELED
jgi:hypothetical protein